jgi:hypothetical protein
LSSQRSPSWRLSSHYSRSYKAKTAVSTSSTASRSSRLRFPVSRH